MLKYVTASARTQVANKLISMPPKHPAGVPPWGTCPGDSCRHAVAAGRTPSAPGFRGKRDNYVPLVVTLRNPAPNGTCATWRPGGKAHATLSSHERGVVPVAPSFECFLTDLQGDSFGATTARQRNRPQLAHGWCSSSWSAEQCASSPTLSPPHMPARFSCPSAHHAPDAARHHTATPLSSPRTGMLQDQSG